MDCLAAGRSISLPANACGIAKGCALTTGAYGRVRQQFALSIGGSRAWRRRSRASAAMPTSWTRRA